MKVWLVGERGMLANSLKHQLDRAGVSWAGSDIEVDITDAAAVNAFAASEAFTHIINCAGFTNVDGAEQAAEAAERLNVQGPANLWRACQGRGATLLHFSTDYVFDGNATTPYKESDTPAPIGVYAATKHQGEEAVLGTPTGGGRAYVLRTSWLYGPNGKNFVSTMLRLMAERPELKVVADQIGRPTYTVDLAQVSLKICGLDGASDPPEPGLYHFANSGATSWHGFASEIWRQAKLSGLPTVATSIQPITTAEFPTPARRPAYSVLNTTRIEQITGVAPRPWQTALADYLSWVKSSQA